jgi:hypothetical protein
MGKKEYKVFYMPYLLVRPESHVGDDSLSLGSKATGGEIKDLTGELNAYSERGWLVRNSGIIEDSSMVERVIFWVLLERERKEEQVALQVLTSR